LAAAPPSTVTSGVSPAVAAAEAFTPSEFVVTSGGEALAPLEHASGDVRATMKSATSGGDEAQLTVAYVTCGDVWASTPTKNIVTSSDDLVLHFVRTKFVVTSSDDVVLHPAPRENIVASGDKLALELAPTEDVSLPVTTWHLTLHR